MTQDSRGCSVLFCEGPSGKNVEVNVVPGISSMLACAAKLCMPWDDAVLITFHKGASIERKREFADAVKAGKTVMLLPDPAAFTPSEISEYLLKAGVNKETSVAVCENLTLANEKIVETTLEGAINWSFDPTCVMVIKGNSEKVITEVARGAICRK